MRDACLLKMWNWIVFFLMLIVSIPVAADEVPFEPYGRLPAIDEIAISPDGTHLALVKSVNEERILYVLSLTDGAVKGASRVGDAKLRGIGWADEKHILLVVSTTSAPPRGFIGNKSEFAVLLVYDISAETIHNPLNVDISSKDITMVDALKRSKKSVEFVTLKKEDHWLSKSDTRLQMLQDTIRFLKVNNPPY